MAIEGEVKVLVIDDEQTYLDLITETLKKKEYKILQALDGKMGCMVARKFIPDIIITDWEMPGLNGLETIKELKKDQLTKDIPVIMCTGIMTSSKNLNTALRAGAIDYIRKPVEPIELIARINSALNLSRSLKKIRQQNEELIELNANIIQKNEEISAQNDQLQYLNATKDKFFGIIAHDLRNPFNNILGMSELLSNYSSDFDSHKMQKIIGTIHSSANSAYKLLGNLLDWAMTQTGKTEYKPENLLLDDLIKNSLEITEGNSHAKQIEIHYKPNEKIFVFADKNMINTVLSNLVTNAIKYTNRKGHVEISAIKYDDFVKVSVEDNGIGIDSDIFSRLFKITEKKSTLGTENEKGSGLGLILCKDFIEKHGGQIGADLNHYGGSTFWFTIPLGSSE